MKKTLTALFLSLVLLLATFVAPTSAAFAEEISWRSIEHVEHMARILNPDVSLIVEMEGDVRIFIHTPGKDGVGLVIVHPGNYRYENGKIEVNMEALHKTLLLTKYAYGYITPSEWENTTFDFDELCSFVNQVFSYPATVNLHVQGDFLTLTVTLDKGKPDEYVAYEAVIDSTLWNKITTVDGDGKFIKVEYFFDSSVLVGIGEHFGSL